MAKKKAAAGAKPPKDETPDERALRLEIEALAAEERARTDAELARVELRQRQTREQACAHINAMKIHNQWRKIMRLAKVEELRGQVEVLGQDHEREVDRKDALVQLLDRDLEVAEEQHRTALSAHLMVVESLLDLQAARLSGLDKQYTSDLKDMLGAAASERAEIAASHAKLRKELQDMAEAMRVEFADVEADARQEYESVREEVRNRDSEDTNVLQIQLTGIIDELERHFEEAHRAYLEGTEHRTAAFKKLTASDATAAHVIEQRMKKLVKLQEDLQHWRTKIAANSREWESRNAALRREKELMARHYGQLKGALDRSRAAAAERLKQLSVMSGASMEDLRAKLGRAEGLLKLAGMCRKLETEQEKVLPFASLDEAVPVQQQLQQQQQQQEEGHEREQQPGSTPGMAGSQLQQQQQQGQQQESVGDCHHEQQQEAAADPQPLSPSAQQRCSSLGVDDAGQPVSDWRYLDRFLQRYNKVVLDVAAVDKERGRLEQENADLRQLLKTFLDGISVNDAVLNSPANPLLVINQRLQAMMAQQRKQKKCGGAQRQAGGGGASGPATGRSTLSAAAAAALSGGITGRALTPAAAPGGLIMSPRMPLPLTSAAAAQ